MEKRTRSPNYPSLSLPEALDKVRLIYQSQHTHGAPREIVVKSMGYAGINGASATAISALSKYGLLEGRGDDIRVSDRAMRFLNPLNDQERREAIQQAAREPILFHELSEKFPGPLPNEDVLRNYLVRNGFAPAAVPGVILAYRDTLAYAEREARLSPAANSEAVEGNLSDAAVATPNIPSSGSPAAPIQNDEVKPVGERSLGRHDFDDGSFVRISASTNLETEEALDWIIFLVDAKRRELKMREGRRAKEAEQSMTDRVAELLS
ncbi:hypothetical protein [Brevundimonas sp. LM2]|uniref:hypothetical protein n=1 Tax=Brevundimonas sp. LM2 TaxID=1938605 RepID=UPI001237316E|nr:hypothetical protein [Brevundimonas sp. LM2]